MEPEYCIGILNTLKTNENSKMTVALILKIKPITSQNPNNNYYSDSNYSLRNFLTRKNDIN